MSLLNSYSSTHYLVNHENAKEIKNFIYKELESKKGKIEFSRYFDISFLEWVGTEISLAALKKILSDKDLFQSATGFETMKTPNHLFEFVSLFLSESEGGKILNPWGIYLISISPNSTNLSIKKSAYLKNPKSVKCTPSTVPSLSLPIAFLLST